MGGGGRLGLRGVESLPVLLLVGGILSAVAAGLGVRAVDTFNQKRDEQVSLQEFQEFTEKARAVCFGAGELQVTITKAEIVLRGAVAQLCSPPRAESLPVPFSRNGVLKEGTYTIRLKKIEEGWFLEVG
jgi:hypothetical protein